MDDAVACFELVKRDYAGKAGEAQLAELEPACATRRSNWNWTTCRPTGPTRTGAKPPSQRVSERHEVRRIEHPAFTSSRRQMRQPPGVRRYSSWYHNPRKNVWLLPSGKAICIGLKHHPPGGDIASQADLDGIGAAYWETARW